VIWTEEADALLRELHADHSLTMTAVALEMSRRLDCELSKNACIGRAHRLGVFRTLRRGKRKPRAALRRSPKPRRRIIVTPDAEEERAFREQRRAVRTGLLIDFDHEQCRWPIEEISPRTYRYCTEDKAHLGSAYCAKHHTIAHPRRDR
jgi:hypothetical protein